VKPLPQRRQTVYGLLTAGLTALVFLFILWIVPRFLRLPGLPEWAVQTPANLSYRRIAVNSAADLIESLRRYHLLEVSAGAVVPPLLFNRFPPDFREILPVARRKKLFFHTLLPAALIAGQEISRERGALLHILSQYPNPNEIVFQAENNDWQERLTAAEIRQALALAKKYKSKRADELLKRIRPVPVSLILAQSAIESAWGGSRFARDGNNIFGIWTWDADDDGLVPLRREKGKTHRVKSFKSLFASVRAYSLILNSQPAYDYFRALRRITDDPGMMAAGLKKYSGRRNLYVRDVQNMIRLNRLRRYDSCKLRVAGHG
jgi:Bax protein